MDRKIKAFAFKLLAKRDYFSQELKRKLISKGFKIEDVEEVVEYLVKEGYINDEKLKERMKEKAIEKGKSPLYLKKKLYQKGISDSIEFSFEEELESALHLLRNKYKKGKNYKEIVKFLKYRGFSYDVIQEAYKKYLEEEEWK